MSCAFAPMNRFSAANRGTPTSEPYSVADWSARSRRMTLTLAHRRVTRSHALHS